VTTRFTFDSAWDEYPVWSPDGSRIAFSSDRGGTIYDLYQKASSLAGEDEPLFKSPELKFPTSWSADGRFLLYFTASTPSQIWSLPVGARADRKPIPMGHTEFNQILGRFSPDGHWIAYASDESGTPQVYVRPFDTSSTTGTSSANGPPVVGKWMVSKDGGRSPLWRRDGKELFYLSPDGTAMAVDVSTSGVFQAGIPKPLFKVPAGVFFWDVSADGKRFIMAAPSPTAAGAAAQAKFAVVLNWQAALKK
jgi:Tol biopolymer transport system component